MDLKFRLLRADEIEVRVSQITPRSVMLLLYKDSRTDMTILDETVGPLNWQRHHSRENANCTVSIYDPDKGCWVEKEDTGTESNTEAEKGLASDSFKRACFNWGVGRELYTAPNLFFPIDKTRAEKGNDGKMRCYDRFEVEEIEYDGKNIAYLKIKDVNTGSILESGKRPGQVKQNNEPKPDSAPVARKKAPNPSPEPEPDKNTVGDRRIVLLDKIKANFETTDDRNGCYTFVLESLGVKKIADMSDAQFETALKMVEELAKGGAA